MKYNVTEVKFDFDDSEFDEDFKLSKTETDAITRDNLGVWEADSEEDLIEEITESSGWCIKSIKYVPNQPHPLTSYM